MMLAWKVAKRSCAAFPSALTPLAITASSRYSSPLGSRTRKFGCFEAWAEYDGMDGDLALRAGEDAMEIEFEDGGEEALVAELRAGEQVCLMRRWVGLEPVLLPLADDRRLQVWGSGRGSCTCDSRCCSGWNGRCGRYSRTSSCRTAPVPFLERAMRSPSCSREHSECQSVTTTGPV